MAQAVDLVEHCKSLTPTLLLEGSDSVSSVYDKNDHTPARPGRCREVQPAKLVRAHLCSFHFCEPIDELRIWGDHSNKLIDERSSSSNNKTKVICDDLLNFDCD